MANGQDPPQPRPPRPLRWAGWAQWWPLAVTALAAVVAMGAGGAEGGLSARITNGGDAVQSGDVVTAAASGAATECDLGAGAHTPITVANSAPCTGTVLPSGTLPASGTAGVATTLSEKGSLVASGASITAGVCGPVELANAAGTNADPLLVRGTPISFAQAGPTSLSGSGGLGLSGTSGYAADVAGTAPPATGFSEAIWFATTTAGSLMGFASTPSAYNPAQTDKMMWVDGAGHVVFGVSALTTVEVTTSGTYNDGRWHLAVATYNAVTGVSLSVDAGTAAAAFAPLAQTYTGYWHVGWDSEATGWTDPPADPYFSGTLADAAVFPSTLSAAQITALYAATTQASWAAQVAADVATDSWPLSDTGAAVFTGTVPNVTPAACAFVDATIAVAASATSCAAPPAATACAPPSAAVTLSSLAAKTTTLPSAPSPTAPVTVTVTLGRDPATAVTSYPYALGLHLSESDALATAAGSFTATLTWPSENVIL